MKQPESGEPSDQVALIERLRRGDLKAFDQLLGERWALLVRYCAALTGSLDEGKDIAQEAFLRIWEQREQLRPSGSLKAFLYQIAHNLAVDAHRSRQIHTRLEQERVRQDPDVVTPAADLDATELRVMVERAIGSLPARRREAFVLSHLQGLTYKDVAHVMGISPQVVANQISAALTDLRRILAPYLTETDRTFRKLG